MPDQICQLILNGEPQLVLERKHTTIIAADPRMAELGPQEVPARDEYHLSLAGHYLVLAHRHRDLQTVYNYVFPYQIDLSDPASLTTENYERLLAQIYLPADDRAAIHVAPAPRVAR